VKKHLVHAQINVRDKDAELCTFVSGFSIGTAGMFCEPNPLMDATGHEVLSTQKKYFLGMKTPDGIKKL
jgi:hypothetical protein